MSFADNQFKLILLFENHRILTQISRKYASKGSVHNKSALIEVMTEGKLEFLMQMNVEYTMGTGYY